MNRKLKKIVRRLFGVSKPTSEDLINDLRKRGAEIGTDVVVYGVENTMLDKQNPYLLKIGNHVRIAEGTKVLTHDYAWSVLKHYSSGDIRPGAVLGAQGAVEIGSCVFIGMNSIITRGVKIGDHVVIGAGSVVTRDCPSGGVYAGNPARRIMSIEEYYHKRKSLQFEEARKIALRYRERFHAAPPKEIFDEYFMLFCSPDEAVNNAAFRKKLELLGNFDQSVSYMRENKPMFDGYEAFLNACYEETK